MASNDDKVSPGFLTRSRKTFLAGAAAVALLGLGASEMMLVPSTPAQAQIQVTPPANAPASFAPIVKQVLPAVVSVKVDIKDARSFMSSNEGRGFRGMTDIPEDNPLYRWFKRFGEGQGRGTPDGLQPRRSPR